MTTEAPNLRDLPLLAAPARRPTLEQRRNALDKAFAVYTAFKADRLTMADEDAFRILIDALWVTSVQFEPAIHLEDDRVRSSTWRSTWTIESPPTFPLRMVKTTPLQRLAIQSCHPGS